MFDETTHIDKTISKRAFLLELVSSNVLFCVGLVIIVFFGLVYISLGENIVVAPHDQLDGEIFTYILHSKHLTDQVYYELMNGVPATGMQMAAPVLLVLYLLFPPVLAFSLATAAIMLIAYFGMSLLLSSFGVRSWLSVCVSFAFAFLPFYSVYGLSVMGVPLLLWLLRICWLRQDRKTKAALAIGSFLFSLSSSLVLSGYAVLSLMLIVFFYAVFFHKEKKDFIFVLALSMLLMVLGYGIANYELILQIFFGDGAISHKSEYVLSSNASSLAEIVAFMAGGQSHAISNQCFMLPLCVVGFLIAVYVYLKEKRKPNEVKSDRNSTLSFLLIWTALLLLLIAVFYVMFHSEVGTAIRNMLPGSLRGFQFDRIYWLYPALWYLAFGASMELMLGLINKSLIRHALVCVFVFIFVLTLGKSLSTSVVFASLVKQISPETIFVQDKITWKEFFGCSLFDEMENEILISDEKNRAETKVVSIGLYPSIALYNGYQCLDGYSNNYPVEYKHAFGEIIQGELEKSQELNGYFNNWGNRCYVFSHELGQNYLIYRSLGLEINDLSINVSKLKEMGCDYIISAVPINNFEELGLLYKGHCEQSEIPYSLYVYSV